MAAIGRYAKFMVGGAAAVLTGLVPYYGHATWFPALTAALGAALVYLVPNAGPAAPPPGAQESPGAIPPRAGM
jgi:hypothetical protein